MNPDDLDKLIQRLQADVSPDVLETLLQEATAGDITASGGLLSETDKGYMSHTHYGWLLAREHDGKTYLLIEDREENLHAIECTGQEFVEFWSRLLGMESAHDDFRAEEVDETEDEEDEHEEEGGGGRRRGTIGLISPTTWATLTTSSTTGEHPS